MLGRNACRYLWRSFHTPRLTSVASHRNYPCRLRSLIRAFSSNLPDHEVVGLPALSPSVEVSKIVKWTKNEGDFIDENETIAVVQTDKAEIDWPVTDPVYLAKILLEENNEVPIGTPCCIFVEEESDIKAFENYQHTTSESLPPQQSFNEREESTPTQTSTPAPTLSDFPSHKIESIPALSPTAETGAIVEWLISEGDAISEGQGIAEIQTDKAVVTWEAIDPGYVAKILVDANKDNALSVGTPVAVFVEDANDISAFADFSIDMDSQSASSTLSASSSAPAPLSSSNQSSDKPPVVMSTSTTSSSSRIKVSPLARKLASEKHVNLSALQGSGYGGRIVSADVLASKATLQTTDTPTTVAVSRPLTIVGDRSHEDIPMSSIRKIIAQRLSESKFSAPHYYVTYEFEMDNLLTARKQLNDGLETKISINDFIIKAVALAIRDVPDVNQSWMETFLRRYNYVDISIAVATNDGLITPIVKDADNKGLGLISSEVKDLASRARENKLLPEEFQGGTFTISNMGMYGVKQFTAIINPPQSCILAVGGTQQVLKPDPESEKGFRTVSTMQATLSSDHRVVDGATASTYMQHLKKYIETPVKLLL